jgi:hypothetical protein
MRTNVPKGNGDSVTASEDSPNIAEGFGMKTRKS